jgi:hypothetical protein
VAVTTLITELKPHREKVNIVSETTHNPESFFAVEEEPSGVDVARNLSAYRRLTASQRAMAAAELKRNVEVEIAEQRRSARPRQRFLFRVKSALMDLVRSMIERINSASG